MRKTKTIISLTCISGDVQDGLEDQTTKITALRAHTETIIETHVEENKNQHQTTRSQIAELSR
jgi:hypothetical protein